MSCATAKVLRLTATGTVRTNQLSLVAGVQVIGGTAVDGAVLYDSTSASAADKKIQVVGGEEHFLNFPLRFTDLHVTLGTGATEVLIHVI